MIRIENLTIAHRGAHPLLSDVAATVEKGTLCALIGRNGAGKSSLLRVMAGTDRPVAGRVLVDGIDVTTARPAVLSSVLAIVTTERIRVSRLTCRDVVSLGRAPFTGGFGHLSPDDCEAVDNAMAMTKTSSFASRELLTLSDGEAQRVMLARALAQDTPVILLDEPTSFLDVPNRLCLTDLLSSLAHDCGKTIVFSTHELDLAFSRADTILIAEPPTLLHMLAPEMERYIKSHPWDLSVTSNM
ncbi:MAG: ABC transporter ATP-binding protein [Muribaculaceae bacterium]|nr:ABC transporter ATP-binding protein [Muribaculaceae bacterium]MDE6315071.1 ABC transporter ATP-binding protein [Muribaculaceae bacterium]